MNDLEKAQARLKAAQLREQAAQIRNNALGYKRQMLHPAYPGQEDICEGKYNEACTIAARKEAEADLIDAQAGN